MKAKVTRYGALDMQVCVPTDWTDTQVKAFADEANPCGTEYGWDIRRRDDPALSGMPERNPCDSRKGFVHVVLDA